MERLDCLWILGLILVVIDGALGQYLDFLAVISLGLFLENFKEVGLLEELNCILN